MTDDLRVAPHGHLATPVPKSMASDAASVANFKQPGTVLKEP